VHWSFEQAVDDALRYFTATAGHSRPAARDLPDLGLCLTTTA
jgi:hypothetical protein